jgi:hypothetical protein
LSVLCFQESVFWYIYRQGLEIEGSLLDQRRPFQGLGAGTQRRADGLRENLGLVPWIFGMVGARAAAVHRAADATAETYVVCYILKRSAFNKLLGPIEEVWKLEALRKVPILFNLPEGQLEELAKRMQTVSVAAAEIIFKSGDPGAPPPYVQPLSTPIHWSSQSRWIKVNPSWT